MVAVSVAHLTTFAVWRNRRGLRLLLQGLFLGLLVIAGSACQADFDVVVTVNEDGSGIVETTTTLDAETTRRLLDLELDAGGLILTDLAQSGWIVDPPENIDGSTVIVASKEFGTASQFAEVMAELSGDDGPFGDFQLTRSKSFARVDYDITGTIDTTADLDMFSDPELEAALGRKLADVGVRYGATEEHVGFRLEVVLPGEIQSEATTGLMDSDIGQLRSEWMASLADDEVVQVALSSATRQVSALVLRGVAVVASVLAALFVFAQVLRILLPDRRRRPGRRRPPPVAEVEDPPADEPETDGSEAIVDATPRPVHRVVALDAMGVLYREGADIEALLIPFARERGSKLSDDEIASKARTLSLGRMTTGQFWQALGIQGAGDELDTSYVARRQLTTGVIKYLRSLRADGVRAACITNDAVTWVSILKARHDLEGLIDPWVVSGSVGVCKPDKPIFEVLRRVTGEPPSSIQVIDDDLDILDAARDLGFATAWFAPEGVKEDARDHPLIRGFALAEEDPPEPTPTPRPEPSR